MPSIQTLVLTDRQATPVNFTLKPVGEKDGVVTVALADSTGAVITEMRFSLSKRKSNGKTRDTIRFTMPTVVTETINGVGSPKVIRSALFEGVFVFTEEHTEAERNNFVGMVASSLLSTKPLVHDMIVKGESVW